ncbi:hypothetical protein B0O80DRAFT_439853 [Mortierella sp. GBAus27b]|nr:hypothetical protein BGX31_007787 [Mortierella sp. GBA43]KAI8359268.1 hypothetical protein B0O80DRAFT_439853 [Mortierella sp. GBAus27b]
MATRSRNTHEKASLPTDTPSGHGVSLYTKELKDTFRLFDTEKTGRLSIKKLQLAMNTLGFEATIDDVQEIVDNTPSLGVHRIKKRKQRSQPRSSSSGKGKAASTKAESQATSTTRRSSRTAAVASRSGSKPKYVDSDDGEFESVGDDDEDMYKDEPEHDSGREGDDSDEPLFTLDDFITMMTPKEDEFAQDEVSRVFQLFDTERNGAIRLEDLKRVVAKLDLQMTDEDLREMINEADPSGRGEVNEKAFADLMKITGLIRG